MHGVRHSRQKQPDGNAEPGSEKGSTDLRSSYDPQGYLRNQKFCSKRIVGKSYLEQSRVELARNGRSELNPGESGVPRIQNIVALLGNNPARHREYETAGCGRPCVSNRLD